MRNAERDLTMIEAFEVGEGMGRVAILPVTGNCGVRAASPPLRDGGITLVETLVALLILAFVAGSILTMFSVAMDLNTTGFEYTELTHSVRTKAEELLASAWYTDDAGRTVMDPELSSGAVHQLLRPESGLNLIWRVQDFEMSPSSPMPPGLPCAKPGNSNVKRIIVTAISTSAAGVGRRNATVSLLKIKG